jgi:alpha-beta hydrolase superfamily lysophospholipase
MAGLVVLAVVTAHGFLHAEATGAVSQRVTIRTDDGLTLAATVYEPPTRPAPAIIYVHQLQKTRREWEQLASQLAAEGIGGLAIDLRGHGESPGSPQDYAGMVQDVRAARRFLSSRPEGAPSRVAIAGASIGATLGALVAAEDSSVVSLVMLSPTMDYRGLRLDAAVKKYGGRPALLVASDNDGYSARTVRELQKAGGGVREALVLGHAGNGTAMLTADPDLARRLLEWFRRTLL